MPPKAPIVLMILDGWGYNKHNQHNAISMANTPQWDEWWQNYPHMLLQASGVAVGLPNEQMGNSEVGHMHIGAGRMIQQDFTRINEAIATSTFSANPDLLHTIETLKTNNKTLHIMGLLSPGGVHSHENHLFALLNLCDKLAFDSVCLHLFLDGRDTPPQSALDSINRLNEVLKLHPFAQVKSICGRYYAMDRDKRWERVEPVYNMLTQGISDHQFDSAATAIHFFYNNETSDEFIPPALISEAKPIADGDAVLFFNFRADRARQLTAAFVKADFSGFKRTQRTKLSAFITMTHYDDALATTALFPQVPLTNTLGEVLAAHHLNQLRIAETEKYAHVTFFFNGGKEELFTNEDRVLIPSPKVATYDLQPEMNAPELTQALIKAINSNTYDVLICNYANADMVGHSGNFQATIKAIECLDSCMQQVWQALDQVGGKLLITADHGNAEEMYNDSTKQAHTAHTNEPVPFVFIGSNWHFNRSEGSLIDIAPTLLTLLGIKPPKEMTGQVLLEKNHAHAE